MNNPESWDAAYMGRNRTPPEPEPAERRRQDRAIYLVAVIAVAAMVIF